MHFCSMTQQEITQQTILRHLEGIHYFPSAEFLFHLQSTIATQHTFLNPTFQTAFKYEDY